MLNHEFLSAEEQKIRRRWLFWEIKIPVFLLSLLFLASLCITIIEFSLINFFILIGIFSFLGLFIYVSYHCIYKKFGMILLTLSLILFPIHILLKLKDTASSISLLGSNAPLIFAHLISLLIGIGYESWLFYLNFRMRKINKKIRHRLMVSSEDYLQAAATFESALSLEDLDAKLGNLMRSTENGIHRQSISEAYKVKKKMFLNG